MIAQLSTRIAIGALSADEMRAVMKAMGMSVWDVDRAMAGEVPDWHGARSTAVKRLLRMDDGTPELRAAVHATLLRAADSHVNFLIRNLRADLLVKD